jgi:hypothetical protein
MLLCRIAARPLPSARYRAAIACAAMPPGHLKQLII